MPYIRPPAFGRPFFLGAVWPVSANTRKWLNWYMEIISTNTGKPTTFRWKGKDVVTGIYKSPQPDGIYLDREGVRNDYIGNPKVHGGSYKAFYMFAASEYPYWQRQFHRPEWGYGLFGENLSVDGLDESALRMGAVYRLGEAVIRITTPREPCYKLGVRFGDQGIIDRFIKRGRPGAYGQVIEPGRVRPGDRMSLQEARGESPDIASFFKMIYAGEKDPQILAGALDTDILPEKMRKQLRRWQRLG